MYFAMSVKVPASSDDFDRKELLRRLSMLTAEELQAKLVDTKGFTKDLTSQEPETLKNWQGKRATLAAKHTALEKLETLLEEETKTEGLDHLLVE